MIPSFSFSIRINEFYRLLSMYDSKIIPLDEIFLFVVNTKILDGLDLSKEFFYRMGEGVVNE